MTAKMKERSERSERSERYVDCTNENRDIILNNEESRKDEDKLVKKRPSPTVSDSKNHKKQKKRKKRKKRKQQKKEVIVIDDSDDGSSDASHIDLSNDHDTHGNLSNSNSTRGPIKGIHQQMSRPNNVLAVKEREIVNRDNKKSSDTETDSDNDVERNNQNENSVPNLLDKVKLPNAVTKKEGKCQTKKGEEHKVTSIDKNKRLKLTSPNERQLEEKSQLKLPSPNNTQLEEKNQLNLPSPNARQLEEKKQLRLPTSNARQSEGKEQVKLLYPNTAQLERKNQLNLPSPNAGQSEEKKQLKLPHLRTRQPGSSPNICPKVKAKTSLMKKEEKDTFLNHLSPIEADFLKNHVSSAREFLDKDPNIWSETLFQACNRPSPNSCFPATPFFSSCNENKDKDDKFSMDFCKGMVQVWSMRAKHEVESKSTSKVLKTDKKNGEGQVEHSSQSHTYINFDPFYGLMDSAMIPRLKDKGIFYMQQFLGSEKSLLGEIYNTWLMRRTGKKIEKKSILFLKVEHWKYSVRAAYEKKSLRDEKDNTCKAKTLIETETEKPSSSQIETNMQTGSDSQTLSSNEKIFQFHQDPIPSPKHTLDNMPSKDKPNSLKQLATDTFEENLEPKSSLSTKDHLREQIRQGTPNFQVHSVKELETNLENKKDSERDSHLVQKLDKKGKFGKESEIRLPISSNELIKELDHPEMSLTTEKLNESQRTTSNLCKKTQNMQLSSMKQTHSQTLLEKNPDSSLKEEFSQTVDNTPPTLSDHHSNALQSPISTIEQTQCRKIETNKVPPPKTNSSTSKQIFEDQNASSCDNNSKVDKITIETQRTNASSQKSCSVSGQTNVVESISIDKQKKIVSSCQPKQKTNGKRKVLSLKSLCEMNSQDSIKASTPIPKKKNDLARNFDAMDMDFTIPSKKTKLESKNHFQKPGVSAIIINNPTNSVKEKMIEHTKYRKKLSIETLHKDDECSIEEFSNTRVSDAHDKVTHSLEQLDASKINSETNYLIKAQDSSRKAPYWDKSAGFKTWKPSSSAKVWRSDSKNVTWDKKSNAQKYNTTIVTHNSSNENTRQAIVKKGIDIDYRTSSVTFPTRCRNSETELKVNEIKNPCGQNNGASRATTSRIMSTIGMKQKTSSVFSESSVGPVQIKGEIRATPSPWNLNNTNASRSNTSGSGCKAGWNTNVSEKKRSEKRKSNPWNLNNTNTSRSGWGQGWNIDASEKKRSEKGWNTCKKENSWIQKDRKPEPNTFTEKNNTWKPNAGSQRSSGADFEMQGKDVLPNSNLQEDDVIWDEEVEKETAQKLFDR